MTPGQVKFVLRVWGKSQKDLAVYETEEDAN